MNICIGKNCKNKAEWKQKIGSEIVYLCEKHHFILRIKVSSKHPLDNKVLEWLKNQSSNHKKVMKFAIYLIGNRIVKGV